MKNATPMASQKIDLSQLRVVSASSAAAPKKIRKIVNPMRLIFVAHPPAYVVLR